MSTKRLVQIEKQIDKIKLQLGEIGVIRPGSLTKQYKNPEEQTGGFYQISYTQQMKSRTEYVRSQFVPQIRQQIRDYKKFRKLVDQWVALGIEYSKIEMKLEAKQLAEVKRQNLKLKK